MAAADAKRCVRNAPYRLKFSINLATTGALVSGAADLDSEVSLDSGSFTDCTNEATEIDSSGVYFLDLTAAENTASNSVDVLVKTSSSNAVQQLFNLPHEPCLDSGVAQAGAASTITLRSGGSTVDDFFNNAVIEIVRGTGAGQFRTVTDYVGSTRVASVDRPWATNPANDSVYILHAQPGFKSTNAGVPDVNLTMIDGNTAAVAIMKALYKGGAVTGTVDDGSPSATSFVGNSGLSSTNDKYTGAYLLFVSGALAGESQPISDYVGSSRTFTFANAFTSAPANGSEFVVLGNSS